MKKTSHSFKFLQFEAIFLIPATLLFSFRKTFCFPSWVHIIHTYFQQQQQNSTKMLIVVYKKSWNSKFRQPHSSTDSCSFNQEKKPQILGCLLCISFNCRNICIHTHTHQKYTQRNTYSHKNLQTHKIPQTHTQINKINKRLLYTKKLKKSWTFFIMWLYLVISFQLETIWSCDHSAKNTWSQY